MPTSFSSSSSSARELSKADHPLSNFIPLGQPIPSLVNDRVSVVIMNTVEMRPTARGDSGAFVSVGGGVKVPLRVVG